MSPQTAARFTKAAHALGAPRISRCEGCRTTARAVIPLPGNPKRYLRLCLVCDMGDRLPLIRHAVSKRKTA